MRIADKWVVHETRDDMYFTGMSPDNYPVVEHLNSRVRQYRSKRAAECAISRIEESGIEYCEFVAEYIECADVQDVSSDIPQENPESEKPAFTEVTDWSSWEKVLAFAKPLTIADEVAGKKIRFAKIMLCRTIITNQEIFGVIARDGKLYSAGIGGGKNAVDYFLDEIRNYLFERVTRGERADDSSGLSCLRQK